MNRLVTRILFDLCLFEHFSPVANFEQQSIITDKLCLVHLLNKNLVGIYLSPILIFCINKYKLYFSYFAKSLIAVDKTDNKSTMISCVHVVFFQASAIVKISLKNSKWFSQKVPMAVSSKNARCMHPLHKAKIWDLSTA